MTSATALTRLTLRSRRSGVAVAAHGLAVRGEQAVGGAVPGEALGVRARAGGEPVAHAPGVRSRSASTFAHCCGSWPSTSTPGHVVGDRRGQPADRGGDHRRAAGLRLERHEPERLVVARHDGEVGGAVVVGDDVARRRAGGTARRRAGRARRAATRRCCGCASPEPLGAPSTTTCSRPARSGSSRSSGRGAQQHVRRLERLDAPDEQQRQRVGAQARAGRGRRRAGPGVNTSRSTPGAIGAHPARVGAVELDELARPRRRWRRSAGRPRRPPAPRR